MKDHEAAYAGRLMACGSENFGYRVTRQKTILPSIFSVLFSRLRSFQPRFTLLIMAPIFKQSKSMISIFTKTLNTVKITPKGGLRIQQIWVVAYSLTYNVKFMLRLNMFT